MQCNIFMIPGIAEGEKKESIATVYRFFLLRSPPLTVCTMFINIGLKL